jgi:hypothetical protein
MDGSLFQRTELLSILRSIDAVCKLLELQYRSYQTQDKRRNQGSTEPTKQKKMRSEPVGMYEESSLCDIRGLTDIHTCNITSHRQRKGKRPKKYRDLIIPDLRGEQEPDAAQNFLEDLCK